jgi:N-acetyl-anhydromuramyl-L-alanine amidase AmpD
MTHSLIGQQATMGSYNLDHKSANLDSRQDTVPTILVLHYTAVDFPTSLYLLTDPNARKVSSHYLVSEEGITIFLPLVNIINSHKKRIASLSTCT